VRHCRFVSGRYDDTSRRLCRTLELCQRRLNTACRTIDDRERTHSVLIID
jgi:hypothetical protein